MRIVQLELDLPLNFPSCALAWVVERSVEVFEAENASID